MAAEEAKWRAEDDVRTLQRAAEVRADKQRMSAATKMAKRQMKALRSVTGRRA